MDEKISTIKSKFEGCEIDEIPNQIKAYKDDTRKGVISLVGVWERKYRAYLEELDRVQKMLVYENKYYDSGVEFIAGIDEVGRGPLAGPVVSAAVMLPKGMVIKGINDSKKLSKEKRELLYNEIMQSALDVSIGIKDNHVIDELNILQATIKSMEDAVKGLKMKPQQLLVDAVRLKEISINQESIIKGDERSLSIAAASIIAKVTRDRMMEEYDSIYPEYDFKSNKGYPTEEHTKAILKYGLTPIHRKTFSSGIKRFKNET